MISMERFKIRHQYVSLLQKNDKNIFYNHVNGKIAVADSVENLEATFFLPAEDTRIDLDAVCYEQLYLVVSESCNFRCKYCRQDKSGGVLNMPEEDIRYAIDTFYSLSKHPRSIVFFGGEPLLNIKGITYAIQYIRSFDLNVSFSMVINGSLCTKEIAEFFSKNNVEVIVSMDGPEALHNQARVTADGKGSYQEALRGYRFLKKTGCRTGITAVIGPHNEQHFAELIDWAIELRPDSLGFCLPHGDENNFAMKLSSFEQVHQKMIEAFDILHAHGIYLVQVEQKLGAFLSGHAIAYECKACGKRIVACRGKQFGICEGPITNRESFCYDVSELPRCIREYKKTSPFYNPDCQACVAYRICGGSCVYDKLTRFGRADIPDECRCGLNRMIAERALEYAADHISSQNYILTPKDRDLLRQTLSTN